MPLGVRVGCMESIGEFQEKLSKSNGIYLRITLSYAENCHRLRLANLHMHTSED